MPSPNETAATRPVAEAFAEVLERAGDAPGRAARCGEAADFLVEGVAGLGAGGRECFEGGGRGDRAVKDVADPGRFEGAQDVCGVAGTVAVVADRDGGLAA